jgi:cytochrome c553
MRLFLVLAAGGLTLGGVAAADEHASKVEACLECHYADDFEGMPADEIAGLIEGMEDDPDHEPLLKDLTDEEIKALAEVFAKGGG